MQLSWIDRLQIFNLTISYSYNIFKKKNQKQHILLLLESMCYPFGLLWVLTTMSAAMSSTIVPIKTVHSEAEISLKDISKLGPNQIWVVRKHFCWNLGFVANARISISAQSATVPNYIITVQLACLSFEVSSQTANVEVTQSSFLYCKTEISLTHSWKSSHQRGSMSRAFHCLSHFPKLTQHKTDFCWKKPIRTQFWI